MDWLYREPANSVPVDGAKYILNNVRYYDKLHCVESYRDYAIGYFYQGRFWIDQSEAVPASWIRLPDFESEE